MYTKQVSREHFIDVFGLFRRIPQIRYKRVCSHGRLAFFISFFFSFLFLLFILFLLFLSISFDPLQTKLFDEVCAWPWEEHWYGSLTITNSSLLSLLSRFPRLPLSILSLLFPSSLSILSTLPARTSLPLPPSPCLSPSLLPSHPSLPSLLSSLLSFFSGNKHWGCCYITDKTNLKCPKTKHTPFPY